MPIRCITERPPWWERRILASDERAGHALAHMRNTSLHNSLETVDTDPSLRSNRKSRLLTAGLALGDEIFI
jgi:hypothetical protein